MPALLGSSRYLYGPAADFGSFALTANDHHVPIEDSYVSYLVLRRFSSGGETATLAAVLAIFGALDMPLVFFSIWFFRTQHPQPVIGGGGSIDPRMLRVWLINWAAFMCFGSLVFWFRYRVEMMQREVDAKFVNANAIASTRRFRE